MASRMQEFANLETVFVPEIVEVLLKALQDSDDGNRELTYEILCMIPPNLANAEVLSRCEVSYRKCN